MKKFLFIILLIKTLTGVQAQQYSYYKADTLVSNVLWKCDKHNGKVQLLQGGFVYAGDSLSGGRFIIDLQKIKDLDMSSKQYTTAVMILENTLKNEFFEVGTYPYAVFDLVDVKPVGTGRYELTGDLTMHGNTVCISFIAGIKKNENDMVLESERFIIDRTDWGVYRMSPKRPYSDDENGWTVPDKVEIKINLKLQKE